jgi:hypothetical protein
MTALWRAGRRRLARRSSTCPPKLEERRQKSEGRRRNPPSRRSIGGLRPNGAAPSADPTGPIRPTS